MKVVLVSVDDHYQERVFTFAWPPPKGVVWIGRGEESDLVLVRSERGGMGGEEKGARRTLRDLRLRIQQREQRGRRGALSH